MARTATPQLKPIAKWLPRRLGCTVQRAYELAREGIVPHVRIGRRVMVDPEQVDKWIASGGTALPGGWRREPTDGAS